jgi:hypothetical protein
MRRSCATLVVALLWACASAPPAPNPGRSGAWGYLKLVPREGVDAVVAAPHAYGDRRLEGVEWVDYSKPGFAVVYAEDVDPPAHERVALAIRTSATGIHLEPGDAALGAGGELVVENRSAAARVVSIPGGGVVRRLAPGESLTITVAAQGEWPVFLLDVPGEKALVFAAPGRYTVVSESGRFALTDLPPGRRRLRAWHPRFPSAATWVDLAPDRLSRVDFELRVDRRQAGVADAP